MLLPFSIIPKLHCAAWGRMTRHSPQTILLLLLLLLLLVVLLILVLVLHLLLALLLLFNPRSLTEADLEVPKDALLHPCSDIDVSHIEGHDHG
jgi:hypothetical protein